MVTMASPRALGIRPAAGTMVLVWAGLACVFAGAGCGYQQSGSAQNAPAGYQWKSLYRGDVKSVAVPIFTNKTFYRNVEFNLTEAVSQQLEAQSPYRIAPREQADTLLEGEITRVRLRTLSEAPGAVTPQEQLYTVRVSFVWKDLRTGKILVERKDFEQAAPYYPTLGEGQFTGQQQNMERLALAIVQELQAAW
ncbi:LPS assembly lipoprotein LptE [Humisphaera borealis]|uniref:Uncharacterized protein n=1 Tax=Humisphaera borealis TaxID=2807512 RepID=A0A7M2X0Y8_9BACT|nr:LptE family protein [Humisphaera borealis]QOV90400.1 hypothetical protein IPV69_03260 [Humisphaera borealis]